MTFNQFKFMNSLFNGRVYREEALKSGCAQAGYCVIEEGGVRATRAGCDEYRAITHANTFGSRKDAISFMVKCQMANGSFFTTLVEDKSFYGVVVSSGNVILTTPLNN